MPSRTDPPPWLHEVPALSDETSIADLRVLGQLPQELSGRFVRIGPSGSGSAMSGLGDAPMVHAVTITGGFVLGYRNRWVLTDETALALGTDTIPGPPDHVGRLTRIAPLDDALLATGPGPVAYVLSPDLKTLRKHPCSDLDRDCEAVHRHARWWLADGIAHHTADGADREGWWTAVGWIGELVEVTDGGGALRWLVGMCHHQDEPSVRLSIWEVDRPGSPVAEVLIPRRLPPALDATWSPDATTARRLRARRNFR